MQRIVAAEGEAEIKMHLVELMRSIFDNYDKDNMKKLNDLITKYEKEDDRELTD